MKRTYRKTLIILLLILGLGSWTLSLGCSKGCFKREKIISPTEGSEKKFELISEWIPEPVNAIIVVDTYKLVHSTLWDDLVNLGKKELLLNLESAGVSFKSDIGLVSVFMEVVSADQNRGPIMLIQGGFNQDIIVTRILNIAAEERILLKSEKYKEFDIYSEDGREGIFGTPYAFAPLGNGIIACAKINDLKWIIDGHAKKQKIISPAIQGVDWKIPIWGKLIVSEKYSNSLPPPWNSIVSLRLEAITTEDIEALLIADVREGNKPEPLKTTLEGFKALEAIQMVDDKEMLKIIDNVTISQEGQRVLVKIPKDLRLLNLILSKKIENDVEKEKTEKDETKNKDI